MKISEKNKVKMRKTKVKQKENMNYLISYVKSNDQQLDKKSLL